MSGSLRDAAISASMNSSNASFTTPGYAPVFLHVPWPLEPSEYVAVISTSTFAIVCVTVAEPDV